MRKPDNPNIRASKTHCTSFWVIDFLNSRVKKKRSGGVREPFLQLRIQMTHNALKHFNV